MKSLEKRLVALEAITRQSVHGYPPPKVSLYLRIVECLVDPEAPPLTPEEEDLERQSNHEFIRDYLPQMRADPGWQSEESQALLDSWEDTGCE